MNNNDVTQEPTFCRFCGKQIQLNFDRYPQFNPTWESTEGHWAGKDCLPERGAYRGETRSLSPAWNFTEEGYGHRPEDALTRIARLYKKMYGEP